MRNLNLEGFDVCFQRFVEVIKGKRHIEISCDEEQIVTDYLSGYKKEVVAIRNAASEEYEQFRDSLVPAMLYLASKIEAFERLFFEDGLISYDAFYSAACCYYWSALFDKYSFEQIYSLLHKELSGISLKMLLDFYANTDEQSFGAISESEFFELLAGCSIKEKSLILSNIDADFKTLTELKKTMLSDNEDAFITALMTSGINYQQVASTLKIWTSFSLVRNIASLFVEENPDIEEIKKDFGKCRNLGVFNFEQVSDLAEAEEFFNSTDVPNIDWEHWMYNIRNYALYIFFFHNICRYTSPNLQQVSQMDELLKENVELYSVFMDFVKAGVPIDEYVPKPIPEFALFKGNFLSRLMLPKAINNKTQKEYLESVMLHDKDFCINVYYILAKEGYLSYDDNAFYSFVSRMSYDYIGETEPNRILWNGEARDLYYFIKWFVGGTVYKMWEKTAKYYVLINGRPIKTNGVTNQTKTPSKRMEEFLKKAGAIK
jgi:hypothetical protein